MNLYEINKSILNCVTIESGENVDVETGEIISAEQLNELKMERAEKIKNIALWVKNLTADATALDNEIKTLTARKKAAKNKIDSLKDWLEFNLKEGEKISEPQYAISWRASERVNVTNVKELPEEFLKYSEPTPDKTGIKKAIKAGREIKGAELVKSNNLQIK